MKPFVCPYITLKFTPLRPFQNQISVGAHIVYESNCFDIIWTEIRFLLKANVLIKWFEVSCGLV